MVANVERDGFDPRRITKLVCTHAHGDHAGGAALVPPQAVPAW